ncbi:putative glycosyltransferase family 2 protein [Phaeomoniella chlamydospora]|uniref:Putative glycosyltransferase family 2 protein n=1 Tax=Phaeomoniella chlamydospora TaxID=158046 RepID=A0A0G2EIS9_PHACM|nr:putative glycosyltransferase family 2 protein [Phaeomoniella chlamydospora]
MACAALNVQVAMTVNSRVIKTFLSWSPDAVDVPLMNGLRVQILPTIDDLPRARKHQFAAFIASEALLVVWDDDASHLVERAKSIESELMALVWRTGESEEEEASDEKKGPHTSAYEVDSESGEIIGDRRSTNLMNTILVAFTLILVVTLLGLGFRSVAIEVATDKQYIRAAFIALVPVQVFFTLFFCQVIVGCIAQCIGPVRQVHENSKYYSAKCSPRLQRGTLPHVTIQCPVYKEGLASVIAPTVKSIKQAISTYELQGGSANMLINDDGLQLLDEEDRSARIEFYADHSIGWTARPKHGVDGFLRRGKFKKASNMNYGLMISNNVEEKLAQYDRPSDWTQADEAAAYEQCLKEVLEENGRAWADGNIRVGDYILLIDSDTRVPADCLLDAVSEMEQSPNVGIMQFSSGVMQVVHTYFESGITFFTNLIYTAIKYTVANGDVAPFVGHNAVLRWSAIQQVSYQDEDGYEKFWSESHVSEDFDMSLRLQCDGYIIRLASWAGEGFKEGVSLTVYDELARWEKYAYGCNELLFHPMRQWIYRGPFTELFRRFLFSNIRFTSKITIISYIGTYYAIGAAWIMTSVNYFAIGWFNGYLDKYYIDSWKVWFSIVIVFNGLGNIALAIMRYRIGERSFFGSLLENFKWVLMLAIFLGGLSLHVSQALLAHMFEIDMTWGATAKEAEFSNFFIEVPKVLRKFKFSMTFALLGIIGMIVLATGSFVPWDWRITDFVAILPMATVTASHLLLPIALNPALMTFSW